MVNALPIIIAETGSVASALSSARSRPTNALRMTSMVAPVMNSAWLAASTATFLFSRVICMIQGNRVAETLVARTHRRVGAIRRAIVRPRWTRHTMARDRTKKDLMPFIPSSIF